MDIEEIRCDYLDGIHLAEHKDSCWALVNTVMQHRVTKIKR
jgi:hypothetical protein